VIPQSYHRVEIAGVSQGLEQKRLTSVRRKYIPSRVPLFKHLWQPARTNVVKGPEGSTRRCWCELTLDVRTRQIVGLSPESEGNRRWVMDGRPRCSTSGCGGGDGHSEAMYSEISDGVKDNRGVHRGGGPNAWNRSVLGLSTSARHPAVAITVATSAVGDGRLALGAVLLYVLVVTIVTVPYAMWCKRQASPTRPVA
jgi:hypothetical protein